jgi:hypothetical protein
MSLLHSKPAVDGLRAENNMRRKQAPSVPSGRPVPTICKNLTESSSSAVISFKSFVQDILPTCDDPHWRPQSKRMDEQIWKHINFVGYFDRLPQDTQRLLEQVGAWEEYGANGWDPGSRETIGKFIFQKNVARHKTMAHSHRSEYYTTPVLEDFVYQFYQDDYEHPIMKFKKPYNKNNRTTN